MTPLLCKLLLGAIVPVDAVGVAVSTIQVRSMTCFKRCEACAGILLTTPWMLW